MKKVIEQIQQRASASAKKAFLRKIRKMNDDELYNVLVDLSDRTAKNIIKELESGTTLETVKERYTIE